MGLIFNFGVQGYRGQIVDATLVLAPKQRNTEDQKAQIKAGKSARDIWPTTQTHRRKRLWMHVGQ
jgi:hypothetical protein